MTHRRKIAAIAAALAALLLAPVPGGGSPPRESPTLLQQEDETTPAVPAGLTAPLRAAEPRWGPAAEREAVEGALAGGAPSPPGPSLAVAAAIERLQAEEAPPGELFALVRVTDRKTGERRVLVRGEPVYEATAYLEEPETAPPGVAYEEISEGHADEDVEIAIRSIRVRSSSVTLEGAEAREEEEEIDLLERNAGGGLSHRIDGGLRRRIESGEIDLADARWVPVVIELKSVPRLRLPKVHDVTDGGLLLAGLEVAAAREEAIIGRKKGMARRQEDLVQAVEAAGGRVTYASWTSGSLDAELPASALEDLARHPGVFSIDYAEPQAPAIYQGDDYFIATDAENFEPGHPGLHGLSSKHSYTSRIVLALGEECIDQTNPAWQNAAPPSGSTRGWFYDCDPIGPCSMGGVENCSGSDSHGTRVAQMMTADFMDGQDPSLSTTARRRRTGTCPECKFFFFQDQNLNNRTKTLNAACDVGVDIFESSISTVAQSCDGSGHFDGALQSLIDCDAVYVQSAGNNGAGPGCTTSYPADHPWTLTVSGVATQLSCHTSGAYYTSSCPHHSDASIGGARYDGTDGAASVVDLAAPYVFGNAINPGTRDPVQCGVTAGTSFAAPIVAGLTAMLMDWYNVHLDTSIFYDNRMRNFMLLMGDRSTNVAGTARLVNDTSVHWGAGRVGLVPFDNRLIWDVYRASTTVGRNDTWTFNVPIISLGLATFFKAAVWHDGKNYSNEPILRLSLDPQGCTVKTMSVDRLDNKVVMVQNIASCTSVDVSITNVGVGFSGAREFHFAAYTDLFDERDF